MNHTTRTEAAGNTFLEMRHFAMQLESELHGAERRIAMLQDDRNRIASENQDLLDQVEESREILKEALDRLEKAGVK